MAVPRPGWRCQGQPARRAGQAGGDGDEQAAQRGCWPGAAGTASPVLLLCAREFPARIPGNVEGRRRSQFLSQMYLASAAGFATSSHGNWASALSLEHLLLYQPGGSSSVSASPSGPSRHSCIPSSFLGPIFHTWGERDPFPQLATVPLSHIPGNVRSFKPGFGDTRTPAPLHGSSHPLALCPLLVSACHSFWVPATLHTLPGTEVLGEQAGFWCGGWRRKDFGSELDAVIMECSSKGAVVMVGPSLGALWMGMPDLQWGEAAAEPNRDCSQVL